MEEDPLAACKGVPVTVLPRLRCRFATETINRSAGAEFDSVNGGERGHDAGTDWGTDGLADDGRSLRRVLQLGQRRPR